MKKSVALAALAALSVLFLSASGEVPLETGPTGTPYFTTFPATKSVPIDPRFRYSTGAFQPQNVADSRAATEAGFTKGLPKVNEPVAKVENREILGPAGKVPVRIYTPDGRGPFPILLFFHGGGWTLGSLNTHDDLCRGFCHQVGCVVVAVAYRLAPETKFPGALEDCYAALEWCAERSGDIEGDGRRIAVAGDSAGGNLSACLALYARDKKGPALALQVLICPVTNYGFDTASYHENAIGYNVTRDGMIYYWSNYLDKPEDGRNPYASPLQADDLSGLPPALILTAQFDPLRDDGEAYAARLHRAGVVVQCTRYLDMVHGFPHFRANYEQAKHGMQEAVEALRKALAVGTDN